MFTPVETSIGAILLQQSTSNLLYHNGTNLGASGFIRQLFSKPSRGTIAFFAGMAASILPLKLFIPELATVFPPAPSTWQQALVTTAVGMLIGWGTKASDGCTSGHMLCGLSQLSPRSAVAVATFFPTAILTHHLVHPSLLTQACKGETPCYTPTYPTYNTTTSLVALTIIVISISRSLPRVIASHLSRQYPKRDANAIARDMTAFFSGLEFGLGLHVTQMANPAKVASFLSFPDLPLWDPSLALIMLFSVLPSMVENHLRGYSAPPRFGGCADPMKSGLEYVDTRFVLGAAVFGVGWGLSGTCPGPAILRSFAQPIWGALFMGGFLLGAKAAP